MRKLIYIGALLLSFAAANGAGSKKDTIHLVYVPQANGDYRLFLFGSDRQLVCEEKDIRIVSQGDAVNPVVISCDHSAK